MFVRFFSVSFSRFASLFPFAFARASLTIITEGVPFVKQFFEIFCLKNPFFSWIFKGFRVYPYLVVIGLASLLHLVDISEGPCYNEKQEKTGGKERTA